MAYLYKSSEYVSWLKSRKGDPYWYGTYFNPCTESKLTSKAKQYPSHYTAARMPRYKDDIAKNKICADCVGGSIKGAMWSHLGTRQPVYASENVPDQSADGMFTYCKNKGMEWGTIKTLPDIPGVAVRYSGHVGVYIGNGRAIEWRGFNYGCVETKIADRKWTEWYRLPWIDYGTAFDKPTAPAAGVSSYVLGDRLLKKGMKGDDVKTLQSLMVESLNISVGSAGCDGDFGSATETAVIKLQNKLKVTADGKYGSNTHKALMSMLAEMQNEEEDATVKESKKVVITGKTVNIRKGAGTQYDILTYASLNDSFPYVAIADNGWLAITVNEKTAWVSNKYAKVQ